MNSFQLIEWISLNFSLVFVRQWHRKWLPFSGFCRNFKFQPHILRKSNHPIIFISISPRNNKKVFFCRTCKKKRFYIITLLRTRCRCWYQENWGREWFWWIPAFLPFHFTPKKIKLVNTTFKGIQKIENQIQPLPWHVQLCSASSYRSQRDGKWLWSGTEEGEKFPYGCTMNGMKDNQIWFDFVLHEIIWFISQSLNVDHRV